MHGQQAPALDAPDPTERRSRPDTRSAGPSRGFRPDVEGLRAVAVGVVLLYHAGVPLISGGYVGVDVFFVISGFLITGLLVRELERSGRISLTGFYARRARRLLPSTAVVLAAVALLAWLLMSPVERKTVAKDLAAAALYVVNWQQASLAVDYSALGADASPVQHFWSLAVEEQFYLVWPLLIIAIGWWCKRGGGRSVRPRLALALGGIAVASFAYSVYLTREEAGAAYFSTFTRGWELAVGGLLALVPADAWRRLPGRVAAVLAAGGLTAIAVAALRFSDETPFPGSAAALPVLGAAAVIAAGAARQDTAGARLLGTAPMRYVGRLSYSWYLWHWPAVAFATVKWPDITTAQLAVVVAASWVPAALTHKLVEDPVRVSRALAPVGRGLVLGLACTAAGALLGWLTWATVPTMKLADPSQAVGAAALKDSMKVQESAAVLSPLPEDADADEGEVYESGCHAGQRDTEAGGCVYVNDADRTGDGSRALRPDVTVVGDKPGGDRKAQGVQIDVVLFGDSHAAQYAPALLSVAEKRGWNVAVLTKSACTPAKTTIYNRQYERAYTECDAWRASAVEHITAGDPGLVLVGNRDDQAAMNGDDKLDGEENTAALRDGMSATLGELKDSGARVMALADIPYPPEDIPSCVSANTDRLKDCAFPLREGLEYEQVTPQAAKRAGVPVIDLAPELCPDGTCPAVIGNVIVYRAGEHITETYMQTLTGWLDDQLPKNVRGEKDSR